MRSTLRLCLISLFFLWQAIPGLLTAQCVPAYTLVGGNSEKSAIACVGDLDDDGVDDWLVGSHGSFAAVYSGADGSRERDDLE